MTLNNELLKKYIKGTISVKEEDEWLSLSRFTEQQSRYYFKKTPDTLYPKTRATAGMKFDLFTDANEISFDYRVISASSRTFYSFDL